MGGDKGITLEEIKNESVDLVLSLSLSIYIYIYLYRFFSLAVVVWLLRK